MRNGDLRLILILAEVTLGSGRVKKLISEKPLPAVKVGNTNRVKEDDLTLVEDRRNGTPPKNKEK
jgi:hypothetical protein